MSTRGSPSPSGAATWSSRAGAREPGVDGGGHGGLMALPRHPFPVGCGAMTRLEIAHTSALDPAVLDAARALLEGVFAGEFEPEDWEHSLGGLHAIVWEDGELVAHGAV